MITQELANFIVSLKFEDIPESAVEKAKICFLDFLGVSLRGSFTKSSQIALKVISDLNSFNLNMGDSTIIGNGKFSSMEASFLNGISAHSLDLDDGHRLAQLHPGCTVIPVALALGEHLDKMGDDFITALVAGYEVAIVLGKIINPRHRNRGFHSTGTIGAFGATAAAVKILDLNEDEISNAFGLAGTQSAGLLESDHAGTMGKHIHAGKASQCGILSALLSQNGFTGPSSILEGEEGFFNALCGMNLNADGFDELKHELFLDLGKFHINDVYLKRYPVCRHLHSTIDSARKIFNEINLKNLELNQIDKITVKTYKIAAEHDNYDPQTPEAVRQSLPASLAIAILKGDINLDYMMNGSEINSSMREIIDKISIEIDEEFDALQPDKRPAKVIIEFKDSLNTWDSKNTKSQKPYYLEKTTLLPQGEPENPFKKEDIIKKFSLLNPEFNDKNFFNLKEMIFKIESFKVRELMDCFNF
ncbi:MmgE/PrpD family protein [Methanobacterium alcaliphilum]|uniref:MmgE/PrpD family protein n=1 Tax=Methanobacterium alcaliphilum TaxID=392018 RepID=UPI002009F65B|nr:MmgE/PrpD family protein [Methanobacterium alcaliphilum]MCK9150327.1 MmgE/PrpD family protein [Methanobacterium alcaliphilum]